MIKDYALPELLKSLQIASFITFLCLKEKKLDESSI